MMEWISPIESSPDSGQEVRFYTASNHAFNGWYYQDCFYRGDYATWDYYNRAGASAKVKYIGRYCKSAVKGWQPLPPPPEE